MRKEVHCKSERRVEGSLEYAKSGNSAALKLAETKILNQKKVNSEKI